MKRKLILTAILVLIPTLIVYVLISNRAKMAAKTETLNYTANPVKVVTVSQQNVSFDLTQMGLITAYRDVAVISEIQGKVVRVQTGVGSYVTAGAAILQLDDELPRAKYQAAQAAYAKAKKDLERMESLHKQEIISDTQLETARLSFNLAEAEFTAARRQYNNSSITAPVSGLISARQVDLGTMVVPGMAVANIVDISKLKVRLNLAEADIFRIAVGDPVTISTDVYPDHKFPGRVDNISAKADEVHTYPVEIVLKNNAQYPLKAGMFGRVTFTTRLPGTALVIPREALIGSIREPQVYIVESGLAKLREITVAGEQGTNIIVTKGLQEGDQVVVSGQNNLSDGSKVTVIK